LKWNGGQDRNGYFLRVKYSLPNGDSVRLGAYLDYSNPPPSQQGSFCWVEGVVGGQPSYTCDGQSNGVFVLTPDAQRARAAR
jgi:hypothetical protein